MTRRGRKNKFQALAKVGFVMSPGIAVLGAASSDELGLDIFLTSREDGKVMLCTYMRPPPPPNEWQDPLLRLVDHPTEILNFILAAFT